MRKLIAALLGVSLLLAFVAVPVVSAASYQGCETPGAHNSQAGNKTHPVSDAYIRGIRAVIWSTSRIQPCTVFISENNSGSSAWIAVIPAPGTPHYGSVSAILQVGIIKCLYPVVDPCRGSAGGTPRLVWAAGGCNQNLPFAQDLGPAPGGPIDFRIYRNSGGSWTVSWSATGWGAGFFVVPADHPETSCWLSGSDKVSGLFGCERWDGGDGCGYDYAPVSFNDVRAQRSIGGTWYVPGAGNAPTAALTDLRCYETTSENYCDVVADDKVQMWTVQH